MSQLAHPNIVRLYDYIEEPDGVYVVMEFVDGDPLDEYILRKTGPIPEETALYLFGQILEGMQYAHEKGVIHRDIKPSNFMVTRDQRVKILDFGIAKLLESVGPQHTKTGARIGTVFYMSPEQVRGEALDVRSDVYSLGITLFQMVTGQCPYLSDATEYEVYQRIVNEPLPRATQFYPAVTPKVQALIDIATAKPREARFQSCKAFWEAVVGEVPLQKIPEAPQVTQGEAVGTRKRRRMSKGLKWTLGLTVLAIAAVLGYLFAWPQLQGLALGPEKIAHQFLVAVEENEKATAYRWASPKCVSELEMWFALHSTPSGRTVRMGDVIRSGERAEIHYQYGGDPKDHMINLYQKGLSWEVDCKKADMIPDTPTQ